MDVSGQFHAPAAFPPGKSPLVPIEQEVRWAPEHVWTLLRTEKSCHAGNRNRAVHSVAISTDIDDGFPEFLDSVEILLTQ
jgi:hypothetical protein